jgi:hypothetical protein
LGKNYQIFQIFSNFSGMPELLGILLAGVHRLQQNVVPVLLEGEVLALNLEQEV